MIVAQTARNGSAAGKILLDEWTNYVTLEPVLVIDDVVRDADGLCHAAGVVNVIERTTAALHGLGHSRMASQTALIPELHREADDIVSLGAEHGRDGGGIDSTGHGDGDGGLWHLAVSSYQLTSGA